VSLELTYFLLASSVIPRSVTSGRPMPESTMVAQWWSRSTPT
jgi:hypothetical protein